MRNNLKKAVGKAGEIVTLCGDANIVVEVDGEVLGGEIVPAVIAAGVTIGSLLHTSRPILEMSAEQIIGLVIDTAVKTEKTLYGDRHRERYERSKAKAIEAFRKADVDDIDENLEELDRILAQRSLDEEPAKSGE